MVRGLYDVVIVGGSVAGCIAALCYARQDLRVAVLERKRTVDDYKKLCTHFIQPMALPTLTRLGLDRTFESSGAVRTKAAFWTRAGWIDPPGAYGSASIGAAGHAYNIERRVLDPLLRAEIARSPTVELLLDRRVTAVQRMDTGWLVEAATTRMEEPLRLFGRLLVAADGRGSPMARLLGNDALEDQNQRAAYFGYFSGIPPIPNDRSLFLLSDTDMGFIYPLAGGRTLLSVYVDKTRSTASLGKAPGPDQLVGFFDAFPDLPDLARARGESPIFGYVDYPNLTRHPVSEGVAYCGDAALSLDPMSGVGCGFAMVSAEMLADATGPSLRDDGEGLDAALAVYEKQFNAFFLPHARGIKADSLVAKSPEATYNSYRQIVADPDLQQEFIALTGRLISPRQFQQVFLGSIRRGGLAPQAAMDAR